MATCSVINAEIPKKSESTESQKIDITVIIGIFFDGTNNNRLQVLIGKKYREKKKKHNTLTNEEKELVKKFATDGLSKGLNKDTLDSTGKIKKEILTDEDINSIYKKHHFRVLGLSRADMRADNFTNIAIMEPFYNPVQGQNPPANTYSYRIYVTGSGTYADIEKSTSSTGLGMGSGETGVVQKVKDALEAMRKKIIDKINSNSDIRFVQYKIHLFGFSRGATEARLFVDLCSKIGEKKRQNKLSKVIKKYTDKEYTKSVDRIHFSKEKDNKIEFPFVGIFDTVSSIGVIRKSIWNPIVTKASSLIYGYHDENNKYLGLNTLAFEKSVVKVVHICAMDEYRENFALVTVPIVKNKVEQFFLPGAHADIGGGYLPGYGPEIIIPTKPKKPSNGSLYIPDVPMDTNTYNEVTLNTLKEQGWIEDGTTEISVNNSTISIRRTSLDGYSYLPLHLMIEKSDGLFDESIKNKFPIPQILPSTFAELGDGNKTTYGNCYYPGDGSKNWKIDYHSLRKSYLHFSSSIDSTITKAKMIVNGPYYDGNNHLQRIIYDDNPQRWFTSTAKTEVTEITPEEYNNLINSLYSHSF